MLMSFLRPDVEHAARVLLEEDLTTFEEARNCLKDITGWPFSSCERHAAFASEGGGRSSAGRDGGSLRQALCGHDDEGEANAALLATDDAGP